MTQSHRRRAFLKYNTDRIKIMQGFFQVAGDTVVQSQSGDFSHYQAHEDNAGDEFDFVEPINYVAADGNPQHSHSQGFEQPDMEGIKRLQEEEERIQASLRDKANREYEEKIKRKEAGRLQLEQFMAKKDKERQQRKRENIQKERELHDNNTRSTQQAGWKKVAENVALKQGEHKGIKDVTRMRESIINKKNDEMRS